MRYKPVSKDAVRRRQWWCDGLDPALTFDVQDLWHHQICSSTGYLSSKNIHTKLLDIVFSLICTASQRDFTATFCNFRRKIFTWQMPFISPNQHCQCTKRINYYSVSGKIVIAKKVTCCIHCHNYGKQFQILTVFWTNNAISNCKQITKFKYNLSTFTVVIAGLVRSPQNKCPL